MAMKTPVPSIMIPAAEIQQRVQELAELVSAEYADRDLTLLGVMTGSLMFLADFMRHLHVPHQVGIIQASSYVGQVTTPGKLKVNLDFLPYLADRHVLLIDDILDTGQTLIKLQEKVKVLQPASIQTATLLWKKSRTTHAVKPDYFGFEIEDRFVVGYGLDYNDDYRHLPDICELTEAIESGASFSRTVN